MVDLFGRGPVAEFTGALHTYEATMAAFDDAPEKNREAIRTQGKAMLDMSERFLTIKRQRIHQTLVRTTVLPFAFMAVFLGLMILTVKLVSQGLLRPLDVIRATTERVARGDFSPIV